jgi:hypothetical protein
MTLISLKKQIVNRISELPKNHLLELAYFIEFLKMHEDKCFIDYVNKRTLRTISDKHNKKKFYTLKEIQAEYNK